MNDKDKARLRENLFNGKLHVHMLNDDQFLGLLSVLAEEYQDRYLNSGKNEKKDYELVTVFNALERARDTISKLQGAETV